MAFGDRLQELVRLLFCAIPIHMEMKPKFLFINSVKMKYVPTPYHAVFALEF